MGGGTIEFDPSATNYAANDTGFNLAPLPTGGPLPFTIGPASVPEPASLSLGIVASLVGLGRAWVRRRKRAA